MKKLPLLLSALLFSSLAIHSQVAITTDGSSPSSVAMLDVKSTTKGVLIPRMTFAQRNAIAGPVDGLMVFCTNCSADGTGVLSMYQGGQWKTLDLNCTVPCSPAAGVHIPTTSQITWKWNTVPIALGYKWNTVNNFSTATDMGSNLSKVETGLTCWTTYTRYVWAYNSCGPSQAQVLTQATSQVPFSPAPTAGSQIPSLTQIVWNWNAVTGAIGYKWSTTNNSETAIDMGTTRTKTETGLSCGTSYTRYAWAYNACGITTPVTMTKSTLNCWACGDAYTVYHVAGAVAPVSKTVSYGTVTNIAGETSLCWITSNLGSDHQASAVNDATEASSGWYWQFNSMQGYKHDGTTRTPNTSWIIDINEYSNWVASNDPCALEMGTGWRIPTALEWTDVDASGGWVTWDGPWASPLKLHAAGRLLNSDGTLNYRGSQGGYWSSTQAITTIGQALYIMSSLSNVGQYTKSLGFSVRCVKN